MSTYRPCILPTESPPSLDTAEDTGDGTESSASASLTPSSPSDAENIQLKVIETKDSTIDLNLSMQTLNIDNSNLLSNKLEIIANDRRKAIDNIDDNIDNSISDNCNVASKNQSTRGDAASTTRTVLTLTLTEDHPLMDFLEPRPPPVVPRLLGGSDCSAIVSLSSTEEDSLNRSLANGDSSVHSEGFDAVQCQRNTSKNNLYFSENFVSSESSPANVDLHEERRTFNHQPENATLLSNATSVMVERKKPSTNHSNISNGAQLQSSSKDNYCANHFQEIPSPDSSTASKPENERSLYHAEVDPFGGCVTLKPKMSMPAVLSKRKCIKPLPVETDTDSMALSQPTIFVSCQNELSDSASSLDSLSDCSLHSDGEFKAHYDYQRNGKTEINTKPSHAKSDSLNCSDTETETESGNRNNSSHSGNNVNPLKIPEYSLTEERRDARLWLKVTLPSGEQKTIDMKVIEPYKRVLSHGGYALAGRRDAIVVFSACYLPDSSRVDYNYVMDNLFLYVLTTLEQLVTDDYILIYLHGSASKRSMPTFHWLKKCYQLIDRRLRKSLKHLYLVHPTFWLKSIMWMTKPFISSKFSRKLSYVYNLDELENLVPVEQAAIPEKVRRYDSTRT